MPPFVENLKNLPPRSKAAFAVATAAIVAIVFLLMQIAGAPSYATLVSGIEPAQTGKVTAALDEQGIAYELRANGTTVAVDKASVAQARVALATAGVAASAGTTEGYELFEKQNLGASDFQNRVTYQRALEGEITRTLTGVDGVTGAQVQLVLPEDELFSDSETPATAAVMLEGSVDSLEGESVQGMAQLVASSVKGLKTSNVTITDPSGRMLWPQGDEASGGAAGATKQAAEGRYERQLEAGLDAMLARTVGPGKAQVVVNADLNVDKTTRKELVYAKKGTPLKTQEETERLEGGAPGAGGVAGTAGNIPSYAQSSSGGGSSNYERETRTTDLGVNKTVSETIVAPGEVQGLKVSLLVDKSVDPAVFASLQNVVANAAGVDTARGDAIEAAQVAFAPAPEAPKAGPVPVTVLGPLKWGGLVIATLVFLFLMWRTLRRREAGTLPQPAWLTEIEKPTPLSEIEAARRQPTQIVVPDREPNFQLQTMEELMEREPDRVAQQVKAWMAED